MFGIGMPELIVIFVIALLVFGPKELPKIGKTIGKAMGEFRRASDELKEGIQREIDLAEREHNEATPSTSAASTSVPTEPPAAETVPETQLELPMAQKPGGDALGPTPLAPAAEATVAAATVPPDPAVTASTPHPPVAQPAETKHV